MKYLIMCEGPNELEVVKLLLENDCFTFTMDDLLGLVPYHARQIKGSGQVQTALNMYPGKVAIFRIGDKLSDKLVIPKEYQEKIISVKKYCTKPELEMLLIISENMTNAFEKVKSKKRAKTFAKENIKCGRKAYKNDTAFYRDYYGNNIPLLVNSIRQYRKHQGAHQKDEHYLAELLK